MDMSYKMMIARALLVISLLFNKCVSAQEAKKIVGGEPVEKGRYPYMVGLRNDNGNVWCGGILIDPMWVLSAARCARRFSKVEIGRLDRSNKTEEYELIDIDFEAPHPNFIPEPNNGVNDNDIMLVRLKEPSTFTPIELDYGVNPDIGTNVTLMGWGTENEVAVIPNNILLETSVLISDKDTCTSNYAAVNVPITDNMICAASPGADACLGDSGGPLIIKGDNSTQDKLVGIISFAFGCAKPAYPGIYTSVKAMSQFIEFNLLCGIEDFGTLGCCNAMCLGGRFLCQITTCDTTDDLFCTDRDFPRVDGFDYSGCPAEFPCYVGDGYCDEELYNTPECNYDRGDCCNFTCTDAEYQCADNAFETCKDTPPVDVDSTLDQIQDILDVVLELLEDLFVIITSLLGIDVEWPF